MILQYWVLKPANQKWPNDPDIPELKQLAIKAQYTGAGDKN